MGILTLIFFGILFLSIRNIFQLSYGKNYEKLRSKIGYIKSVGLFAMIVGILGQLMGLFQAFQAIEKMGDVSPALLAGGIKVSMITTLYGIIIYAISLLIWFVMDWKIGESIAE